MDENVWRECSLNWASLRVTRTECDGERKCPADAGQAFAGEKGKSAHLVQDAGQAFACTTLTRGEATQDMLASLPPQRSACTRKKIRNRGTGAQDKPLRPPHHQTQCGSRDSGEVRRSQKQRPPSCSCCGIATSSRRLRLSGVSVDCIVTVDPRAFSSVVRRTSLAVCS